MNDGDALRPDLKSRIERLASEPLTAYRRVQGGYTPALRLVCAGARTSFFAKIATNAATCDYLHREIAVYRRVSGPFMPKVLAWEEHDG